MKKTLASLVLVLSAVPSWGAPSISGLTCDCPAGDLSLTSPSTFSLTGTSLNGSASKSAAKMELLADFNRGLETLPSTFSNITDISGSIHAEYTTGSSISSGSVKQDATAWTDATNQQFIIRFDYPSMARSQKYRITFHRRTTGAFVACNEKWVRAFSGYDSGDGNENDWYFGTSGSDKDTRQFVIEDGVVTPFYNINSAYPHPRDRSSAWKFEMVTAQVNSSAGATDGVMKIRVADNGTTYSNTSVPFDHATNPEIVRTFMVQDDPSSCGSDRGDSYFDLLAFEDSWHGVWVGDASTLSACTYLIPQPLTSHSDGTIEGYWHAPGLTAGTTVYVYVSDADDAWSSGHSVVLGTAQSGGGGGGGETPASGGTAIKGLNLKGVTIK